MKAAIRYEVEYAYAEEAGFSPHWVRLFPRSDIFTRADRVDFRADPSADVQYRHDIFGNFVGYCFYPEKLAALHYALDLDMTLEEKNPFHFLVDSHALRLPFTYKPEELRMLAPYLERTFTGTLPPGLQPGSPRPTVEALVALNGWIFENLEYERRDEGEAMPPGETLSRGAGACRDFGVLFAAVLREHGVAARLASGFLWEPPDLDASERRAESALHAWVEAFVPGPGWIGMDPTNGVFCNHHFITAAVGLTPDDITPVKGFYYGKKHIESRMTSTLTITPL